MHWPQTKFSHWRNSCPSSCCSMTEKGPATACFDHKHSHNWPSRTWGIPASVKKQYSLTTNTATTDLQVLEELLSQFPLLHNSEGNVEDGGALCLPQQVHVQRVFHQVLTDVMRDLKGHYKQAWNIRGQGSQCTNTPMHVVLLWIVCVKIMWSRIHGYAQK